MKAGVLIKSLTREISEQLIKDKNVFLIFEYLSSEEVKLSSISLLLVRATKIVIHIVKVNITKKMDAYENIILKMNGSRHIIQSLIGKSETNMNKLRKLKLRA